MNLTLLLIFCHQILFHEEQSTEFCFNIMITQLNVYNVAS